jgi:signal transduction histidine kinase
MGRGAKPGKAKGEAKRPAARGARKSSSSRVHDLEKRLAEAQKREVEALEQQTATSEILHVILVSPTNVQPVLDSVAESATRLCEAQDSQIFRRDGERLVLIAHHGPIASAEVGQSSLSLRGTANGRSVLEARTIHVPDLQSEGEEYPDGSAVARDYGHRTVLIVPLLREGVAIGSIALRRSVVQLFTQRQVALLQTFAAQAVIAIENVRLFKETKEALERQTATSEILRVISSSPTDVQPVFDAIAESAVRLCDAMFGGIFLVDGDRLRAVGQHGPIAVHGLVMPINQGTVAGRTVLERRAVHIPDLQAEGDEFPEGSAIARELGHRTTLGIPLLRKGAALGAVVVRRAEAEPFSDKQISLLETFADQAVIAIENVRLFNETKEALEQQTATSEILRTITHAQSDVRPVFDTIVRSAAKLCHATTAAVFVTDGGFVYHPANYGGSPEALAAVRSRYPRPIGMDTPPGAAILTRSVVHMPDIEEPSALEFARQSARMLGSRSLVTVPMLREGQAVGAILVTRREPGRFSDGEVELLKTFADQAVIAIENVRLFKELEARTRELTHSVEELRALGEVSQAVSSTLKLETVLATIVSRAVQMSGSYEGIVYEFDEATQTFHARATHQITPEHLEALRRTPVRLGEGAVGRAGVIREPVEVADVEVEWQLVAPQVRALHAREGMRSLLAVPLVREDRLFGGLVILRRDRGAFSPEVVDTLRTLAAQSVLAIQNARLFQEIEDKSRQLEAASRHKSEFLANMSHELRTPLNAVIGFSEVLLQRMFGALNDKQDEYLKDIYASGQHLLSLINDILDLSKIEAGRMELAPAPFHLPTALENAVTLVKERAGRHGIVLQVNIDPQLGEFVGDERKVKQVLLNLLSNAVKFTPEGGRISLKAGRRDGAVAISVTDTGIGIAPEDQAAIFEEFRQVGTDDARKLEGTGLGLTLAKKFVELHDGRMWVESELGRGSTFTFTLPVS